MSIKLSSSAIIREAKRIKTTPSILATKALKFKGKPDCQRLVSFIKSSGEELSKVSIPNSKSLVKGMGGGGGSDGGLSDLANNDALMNALMAAMYPRESITGALIGGGLGLGALGMGGMGIASMLGFKGPRNLLSKGISKTKNVATKVTSKLSNAGKGVKNFFGKGGDEAVEAVAKKTAKKVGPKVAAKTAKGAVSKGLGALPLIGNLWDLGSAAYRFKEGDTVGGLLSLGSAIPIAGWGFAALDIARDGGAFEKTPLKSKKDEDKEEKKDENEVKKSVGKDEESDRLNQVIDKFDSTVDRYSVKGKSFGTISKATKWFGFNTGGKVPGSGNRDTVPAMLTPGEVVMSKPAVDKIGADNLLALNAAGGGTNKPTVRGGDNEGSLINRIQPEDLIHVNNERKLQGLPPLDKLTYAAGVTPSVAKGPGPETSEYTDTHTDLETMTRTITKTINGETTRESFKLSNKEAEAILKERGYPSMKLADGSVVVDSASINYDKGIEALQLWRAQMAEENPKILAKFNALPDVIEMDERIADGSLREEFMSAARMHKKGTKENLMQKNMNRIEQMDGGEGVKLMNFNGGGLVQYFNRGGLVKDYKALKLERSRLQRDPDGRLTGKNRKKWNQLSKEMNALAKQISSYNDEKRVIGDTGKKQHRLTKGSGGSIFGNKKQQRLSNGGGLGRLIGGAADMMTGNLFDFDNKSGGGLIRKTAGAVGGLFGGGKGEGGRNKPKYKSKLAQRYANSQQSQQNLKDATKGYSFSKTSDGNIRADKIPTPIEMSKQTRSVGTIDNEGTIINIVPSPPVQQGGGSTMVPVPIGGGGGSQSQASPSMPSAFQIVNSIRITSLLTKLSLT